MDKDSISIVVKAGTRDPDFGIDIGGWQGRIVETDAETAIWVCIAWDSITLRQMPAETIEKSEREGLDWTRMWLDAAEVEPAAPRDTPQDVDQARDELARQVEWLHLGEPGKHIQGILHEAGDVDALYAWEAYLEEHLVFPFLARVTEYQEGGPLQSRDRLKVLGISMVDDLYGIIVDVRMGRSRYAFPLCDLDVVDQHTATHQIVEDYCTWFANR